jgi:hypothetical protein
MERNAFRDVGSGKASGGVLGLAWTSVTGIRHSSSGPAVPVPLQRSRGAPGGTQGMGACGRTNRCKLAAVIRDVDLDQRLITCK